MTDWWPKQLTPLPADDPAAYAAELCRRLENPDTVLVLDAGGRVCGVREMTLGEMWAEPGGEDAP
jgi:hypothetical protein